MGDRRAANRRYYEKHKDQIRLRRCRQCGLLQRWCAFPEHRSRPERNLAAEENEPAITEVPYCADEILKIISYN